MIYHQFQDKIFIQEKIKKNEANTCTALIRKEDMKQEKPSIQEQQIKNCSSLNEANEQEKNLFVKIWDNRIRIHMQR